MEVLKLILIIAILVTALAMMYFNAWVGRRLDSIARAIVGSEASNRRFSVVSNVITWTIILVLLAVSLLLR